MGLAMTRLIATVVVVFMATLLGCSSSEICSGRVSDGTVDPNGAVCTVNCQCNNQEFSGTCATGQCVSKARGECSGAGAERACVPAGQNEKCKLGRQVCKPSYLTKLRWGDCEPLAKAPAEKGATLCLDGIDNDCDGKTDLMDDECTEFCRPGSKQPCYTGPAGTEGKGTCKGGVRTCGADNKWPKGCDGEVLPGKEMCDGEGKDEDCDGQRNEGCPCVKDGDIRACYTGKPTTKGVGRCKDGIQVCRGGGWGPCTGEQKPEVETCNLKDDDCDGIKDEFVCEVKIPAGTFTMGSPSSEPGRNSNEGPQHKVTLTRGFYLWKYEVTQGEFQALMGRSPSHFNSCGSSCAVEQVSWHESLAFCNALSKKNGLPECFSCTGTGRSVNCSLKSAYAGNGGNDYYKCKGYRLPTETEWEYAYRAGTTTAYYNGPCTQPTGKDPNLEKIGWYRENSGSRTHPVGNKAPNAWGLYDMAGNVWEWVWDRYGSYSGGAATDPVGPSSGSYRVFRGGGWYDYAKGCHAAFRNFVGPGNHSKGLGLRLCRSAP